jgi:hypothetical protein
MNERIRQLSEQAKVKVWCTGGELLSDKAFEIVTELVVQECAQVIDQTHGLHTSGLKSTTALRILEHFGVEE